MSHDIPDNSAERELGKYPFVKEFLDKNKGKAGVDAMTLLKQFNQTLQSKYSAEELEVFLTEDSAQFEEACRDTENSDQESIDRLMTALWARMAVYRSVINVAKGLI